MKALKSMYSVYNKKETKKHYWLCNGVEFDNFIEALKYSAKNKTDMVEVVR